MKHNNERFIILAEVKETPPINVITSNLRAQLPCLHVFIVLISLASAVRIIFIMIHILTPSIAYVILFIVTCPGFRVFLVLITRNANLHQHYSRKGRLCSMILLKFWFRGCFIHLSSYFLTYSLLLL